MKKTTLCLALAGLLAFGAAQAQTTMKISISMAQNSHQGVGIDTFAKEVETAHRRPLQGADLLLRQRWAASAKASRRCSWARRS